MFELNFRDERYLPFEGAGAISEWSLELFTDAPSNNQNPAEPDFGRPLRQFDYGTISDAVVHVKYTAREDAGTFKNLAITNLREYYAAAATTRSVRAFTVRSEFPTQWHRFLNPSNAGANVLEVDMGPGLFPLRDQGKILDIDTMWLLARCKDRTLRYEVVMPLPGQEPPNPADDLTIPLAAVNQYGGLHFSQMDLTGLGIQVRPTATPVKWRLTMGRDGGDLKEEVEDVILVLAYHWE